MKKTNVGERALNVVVRDKSFIGDLYAGIIVTDADITNQYGLSMLYNGRTENSDYTDIFDNVLEGIPSVIIKYENNYITRGKVEDIVVLDEDFLSTLVNNKTPILLKNKSNGFKGFMSLVIPDYGKKEYDLAICAITSDDPIIIIQESKTGCVAIVNANQDYLLAGIISRTIEKMKKIASERTEEKLEFDAVVMPHRRHIEIPTTYDHKLAIYLSVYLNNVNIKNIYKKGDNVLLVDLSVIDAIVSELQKYMSIENITICKGAMGDRDLTGELIYGSYKEAKLDNAFLQASYNSDNTLSNEARNILRRNIMKRNIVFLRKL